MNIILEYDIEYPHIRWVVEVCHSLVSQRGAQHLLIIGYMRACGMRTCERCMKQRPATARTLLDDASRVAVTLSSSSTTAQTDQ